MAVCSHARPHKPLSCAAVASAGGSSPVGTCIIACLSLACLLVALDTRGIGNISSDSREATQDAQGASAPEKCTCGVLSAAPCAVHTQLGEDTQPGAACKQP